MQRNKLRDALLLRILLPMCAILLVSGAFSYWLALSFTYTSKDRSLSEDARSVGQQVRVVGDKVHLNLPRAAVEMLAWDGADHQYFEVDSARRGSIAGTARVPMMNMRIEDMAVDRPYFYEGRIADEEVRIVALRMRVEGTDVPVVVRVATTVNRRKMLTQRVVAAVVVPQLALILVAVVAIWRGVKTGLSPLNRLADQLGRRQRDDLVPLNLADVPAEVVPLIEAFNELLFRLAESAEAQQRFIADAAHQLRTPLAALKAQINWAMGEQDPAAREAALQQLSASVDRAARLSNQLLLLARAEPNSGKKLLKPLDLRALAFEVGSQWVARALREGRDLGFAGTESPAMIQGDTIMVGELINNLLDNALRYGGTHITLRVDDAAERGQVQLTVEDDGPGIPPAEHEQIFERFHRVAGSPGEGSGLGLAIVREIARSHDAQVTLHTPAGGGLRIGVVFPRIA